MINYIPGIIHESFQKSHYYLVTHDFNLPVCKDMRINDIQNYDIQCKWLDAIAEYILVIKYFKPEQSSDAYVYLEGYYDRDNIYHVVNQESTLTIEFITLNNKVFQDITKIFIRNKKIENILN